MNEDISQQRLDRLTENSADIYLYKNRVRTNIIYIITLVAITIIIALLPIIHIDITVSAVGHIRPVAEKTIVTASVSELVDSVYVKEGDSLQKGDLILTQRTIKNYKQQDYRKELIADIDEKLKDLEQLTKGRIPSNFSSLAIRDGYSHYKTQRQRIMTELEQYTIEWQRNKSLYDAGLISESEYNKYYYQYVSKNDELATLDNNQKSVWQNELFNLRKERKDYRSVGEELQTDNLLYEVRSPISGTLDQFAGIYKGSSVSAGQQIAVVSPGGRLRLDVYIAPRDIAFITRGQRVRIQVDALNYNEWGTLDGTVTDISSDMIDDGNANYFYKVKCAIDSDHLTLRNTTHKAFIKKGMSATAHFIVTRQSLFTLLYRNIDEWANPTQYNKGQ